MEHKQAHLIINGLEHGIEYDTRSFMAVAWKLWEKARELDVLPEAIESSGAEGLQLLVQMQLLDEAELKKRFTEVAGFIQAARFHFNDDQHMRYQTVLGRWEYTKKPLNIVRKQSDRDFHRDLAIPEMVNLLEQLGCYHVPRIHADYPGETTAAASG